MDEQQHNQTGNELGQAEKFLRGKTNRLPDERNIEEFAAELAHADVGNTHKPRDVGQPNSAAGGATQNAAVPQRKGLGYAALILGILSLFFFPALFGSAAVTLGIISYFQGNRAMGAWSTILGLISLTGYYWLVPLYA
jgi:hypothetical protein